MIQLKNNRAVKLGVFITVGVAIFAAAILTLGGQKKTFIKSFHVNAIFNDVGGLQKGGNIWFSGVKIGVIKKISLYGDSQVLVLMNIEMDAQAHIHKNAKAKISTDGLIGNKIIVIYDGDATQPQVEEDDYLAVVKAMSTDDMMATLQNNNENILAITNDFKSISKKIDSGKGTLGILVNDAAIANKLNETIDNLQVTVTNLKTVSENSKTAVGNFQAFSAKLNQPGSSINKLVKDTIIYGNVKESLAQLQKATNSVTIFTANLKAVSQKLNQNNNTVGVLLNDSTAASSIKITLKNLETGSKKLDQDLEALQHNFLLRRFFKKKKNSSEGNKNDE
jgi:phospholipid/cholesterol/gamma-HCH transport system substrate-binding protein